MKKHLYIFQKDDLSSAKSVRNDVTGNLDRYTRVFDTAIQAERVAEKSETTFLYVGQLNGDVFTPAEPA